MVECQCSSGIMVLREFSKLEMRVRFSPTAPKCFFTINLVQKRSFAPIKSNY